MTDKFNVVLLRGWWGQNVQAADQRDFRKVL